MAERRRSAIRTAVVWNALAQVLQARQRDAESHRLLVVDLGGGTGGLAVRIAESGHQVVVVDPSPDALASLERRAADAGVGAQVRGVQGDETTLAEVVEPASADLVVCHGVLDVLEAADAPGLALRAARRVLVPGGSLSVLVAQRSAAVFNRALSGHLADARVLLRDPGGRWGSTDPMPRRFSRPELESLLLESGFTLAEARGIRVFTDHLPGSVVDEPGAGDDLLALEEAASAHPDLMALASQLHILAVSR